MSDETPTVPLIEVIKASIVERLNLKRFDFSEQIRALTHLVVISLVLASLNWIFAKSDPGWLKLNPSPWIILPFYMGFRFRFLWGLAAGLLLLVVRVWIRHSNTLEGDRLGFSGAEHFLLWGAVLMGVTGGFLKNLIRRKEEQKQELLETSLESNESLKQTVALLKHNEQDLSSTLVSQGLESSGLALNLQEVINHSAKLDQDDAFLNLLRDRCGVKSAAIYFSARGGRAIRVAQLRSDSAFPESIDKTPMFEHAERTGKIVTQRWFWEPIEPNATGGFDDYYLAVVAHPRDRDFRVLVISRMDFEQIHWENFWKIESAFRWFENSVNAKSDKVLLSPLDGDAKGEKSREKIINDEIADNASDEPLVVEEEMAEFEEAIREPRPILDASSFKRRLDQCRQIEEQMGLEHRLVIFVPGESESTERCEAFAHSLSVTIPPSDDLALIPSDGGRFVYGLITAAPTTEKAEEHAGSLLAGAPELDLRFFVLQLNDKALSAFAN